MSLVKISMVAIALLVILIRRGQFVCPGWVQSIVKRQSLIISAVASLAFVIAAGTTALKLRPPEVHDELSNLLLADTFSSGRLTNPTHPFWEHFESFHIIQKPTYTSKYPPARGALHALGTVIGGHPIVGSWIGMALAAGAVCWMLYGWLPPWWAALGGLIIAIHPSIQIDWAQTYWGGLLAVAGSALVYGALPRLLDRPFWCTSLVMGIGLMVLANNRPYEGLVVSLPVAVVLLVHLCRHARDRFTLHLLHLVLPVVVVVVSVGSWMVQYNLAVTGQATKMPYQVHEESYGIYNNFLWKPPREIPVYRHSVMRKFHVETTGKKYYSQQTRDDYLDFKGRQFRKAFTFYFGRIMLFPLMVGLISALLSRSLLLPVVTTVLSLCLSSIICALHPHYLAPLAPVLFLLLMEGLRRINSWTCWRSPVGQAFVGLIFAFHLLNCGAAIDKHVNEPGEEWALQRQQILSKLETGSEKHLVIVEYSSSHNTHDEWVYNRADLDAAKVIWARDMGVAKNSELIDYFDTRQVWRLRADEVPARLVPYEE